MSPVKAPTGGLANIWLSHTVDTKSNMTPLQRDQLTHTHCSGNYFKKEGNTMSQRVRTESKEQSQAS